MQTVPSRSCVRRRPTPRTPSGADVAPDLRLCEMASDWVRQIEEEYEVAGIYLSPVSGMRAHDYEAGPGF